ncbi:SGNH/GDSL hydrolase family protein [Nocardia caishijiensis]|uniref:Lysophospholipase L1-like esterase n=1 Tax=Nocardia caishijiensis TaxID=184756 RepID=A0ABQ6YU33_9NOCA|nr:SGNH/GDSL hydrolase family protein [Nocardia caishijiensis]KAF0849279.1 lysophospholipase L1-like esterase [Nocardia caishijiensis]
MHVWKKMMTTAVAITATLTAACTSTEAAPVSTTAWSVPMQQPSSGFEPNWSLEGFARHTLRQVVRVTTGGDSARITLSNRFGRTDLRVASATIARTEAGARVHQDTLRPLRFHGSETATISPGADLTSDPADLRLAPFESATVTLYLDEPTGPATFHAQGYATSYRATGNHTADTDAAAFTETTHSWYFLSSVRMSGEAGAGAVVAFGDSITDGFGSDNDGNNRYPDALADRLAAAGTARPVLNAGIGGNTIVSDSPWYGESALRRFDRDVLEQPGVGTVVMLGGLNDIGFSEVDLPTYKPNPVVTVEQLIAGYRDMIDRAHRAGLRVVGGTLLPMKGAEYYTPTSAAKLRALNEWIRTSGEFDAVADFNTALADPTDPERLNPTFDSGDHRHPNAAGYRAMAAAIDLNTL